MTIREDGMLEKKSTIALRSLSQIGQVGYKKDMQLLWDKLAYKELYQESWNSIRHVMECCVSLYDPKLLAQKPSEDWRLEKFKHYIKIYLGVFKEYLVQQRSYSSKFDPNEESPDRFANSLISFIESIDSDESRLCYLMFKEVQRIAMEG